MKKLFVSLLILTMLCGCSTSSDTDVTEQTTENLISNTQTTEVVTSEIQETVYAAAPETIEENILIAYFSQTGNTEKLAEDIHNTVGGDMFEITTVTPYPDDYNTLVDQARQEQDEDFRPELATHIDNIEQYDIIFLGYPNWWSDLPMPVFSFLDEYDLSGKTIIPFCTSGGGGFGNGVESMQSAEPDAVFEEGFEVDGSSVDSAETNVNEWLDGLGLEE